MKTDSLMNDMFRKNVVSLHSHLLKLRIYTYVLHCIKTHNDSFCNVYFNSFSFLGRYVADPVRRRQ